MHPDLVVFDFDGTLADTREAITTCMQRTFEGFGLPAPPRDAVEPTIGLRLGDAIQALHGSLADREVARWVEAYRETFASHGEPLMRLYDGVIDVLDLAGSLAIPLAVLSNRSHASLERGLERLGIAGRFRFTLGDRPGQPRKPDRLLYDTLIRPAFAETRPGHTLIVGDTETDLAFARAVGAPSCWAAYGYGEPERCRALEPDCVLESILDLGRVLEAR